MENLKMDINYQEKDMIMMEILYMKLIIKLEKEKNMIIMEYYYLKANIQKEKEMELEKNIQVQDI